MIDNILEIVWELSIRFTKF